MKKHEMQQKRQESRRAALWKFDKQIFMHKVAAQLHARSSKKERRADALAPGAEERRDKLR